MHRHKLIGNAHIATWVNNNIYKYMSNKDKNTTMR